jgi:hypothetical protein
MPAAKAKKAKTTKPKKKSAARKRAASGVQLTDALASAAWAEADRALAEALALCDEALQSEGAAHGLALEMLGQALTTAGRKRGLSRLGELGGREAFDPDRHEFIKPPKKTPKSVRIVARGVARGGEMLTKARVGPVGRAKTR